MGFYWKQILWTNDKIWPFKGPPNQCFIVLGRNSNQDSTGTQHVQHVLIEPMNLRLSVQVPTESFGSVIPEYAAPHRFVKISDQTLLGLRRKSQLHQPSC